MAVRTKMFRTVAMKNRYIATKATDFYLSNIVTAGKTKFLFRFGKLFRPVNGDVQNNITLDRNVRSNKSYINVRRFLKKMSTCLTGSHFKRGLLATGILKRRLKFLSGTRKRYFTVTKWSKLVSEFLVRKPHITTKYRRHKKPFKLYGRRLIRRRVRILRRPILRGLLQNRRRLRNVLRKRLSPSALIAKANFGSRLSRKFFILQRNLNFNRGVETSLSAWGDEFLARSSFLRQRFSSEFLGLKRRYVKKLNFR